jgi:hypothetical protein
LGMAFALRYAILPPPSVSAFGLTARSHLRLLEPISLGTVVVIGLVVGSWCVAG